MFHAPISPAFSVTEALASPNFARLLSYANPWIDSRLSGSARRDSRKEIERFVLWQIFDGQSFPGVDSGTSARYRSFLANPEPLSTWAVSAPQPRIKDGLLNPAWRPFAGPLSPSSVKQACSILYGYFHYLEENGTVPENPFRIRRGRGANKPRGTGAVEVGLVVAFALSHHQERAYALPDGPTGFKVLRSYWALVLIYFTGGTALELVTARMGDFFRDDIGWWLRLSSGSAECRTIPLSPEFLKVLTRYRAALGLVHFPAPSENEVPLIGDVFLGRRCITPSAFYKLVKAAFLEAGMASAAPAISNVLDKATPTWLQRFAVRQIAQHRLRLAASPDNPGEGSPLFEMAVAQSHQRTLQPD
jgi:integrase